MNTNQTLLPIGTRVTHFDGGPNTHGKGTIVKYNGVKPNEYMNEKPIEAMALAAKAGLGAALLSSLYDGTRCPYVVHYDPSERYPEGYKDVYEPDSIQVISTPAEVQHFRKGDRLKVIWNTDEDGDTVEGMIMGEVVIMKDRSSEYRDFIIVERANGREKHLEKVRFELADPSYEFKGENKK
jgi:hypothetical protein